MPRPTLLSDRPRSSDVPSDPAPASRIEQSTDFGRWLTRDLRTKGTPSLFPSQSLPSQAPPSQPSSQERPSQPSVVIDAPEEPAALASWLLSGLKPRQSAAPGVPSELGEGAAATMALLADESGLESSAGSLAPPDSLMPHAVSELPRARATLSPASALDVALDADDLAVLPSRARRNGQRRWRHVALAALLLGTLGFLFLRGSGSQVEAASGADTSAAAAQAAEVLPPPPPSQDELADDEEVEAPAAPVRHAAAAGANEPELPELPDRVGRRAGDAIARFADLPSPTLSKLAREERQKARERAARARAQKASTSSAP